jgi:hypothetical protein
MTVRATAGEGAQYSARASPQTRFAERVRTLDGRLEETYAERVSLARANGR